MSSFYLENLIFFKLPEKIEIFRKFAWKNRNFSKICLKNRNFSKRCLNNEIVCEIAWKKSKFLGNLPGKIEILLIRIHRFQTSCQLWLVSLPFALLNAWFKQYHFYGPPSACHNGKGP